MPSMSALGAATGVVSLVVAVAACGRPVGPTIDSTSARRLPAGDVIGFTGPEGSHVWRGIPYAAPPVGELRWRAPRPARRWEGTRQALLTGEACPQFASALAGEGRGATGIMGDEDCLYLDVYAPRRSPDAVPTGDGRFPVMVWIHGGATVGRAGFWNGGRLAATHEVIVVTINYRMGAFGQFRHASLRGEGVTPAERSGNFGQLDHIRALEWVRENIAAFGGDPHNVTIFGEGFGGFSVVSLVLSPLARGLFHRAVVQSSPGWSGDTEAAAEHWTDDPEPGREHSSNEVLGALLVKDGTAPDRQAAKEHARSMTGPETEAYLRGKTAREILSAYVEDPDSFGGGYTFGGIVRDGVVLPIEAPLESVVRGAYHRVPIILGTTRDEKKLTQALDPAFVHWRLGLFPHAVDPEHYDAAADHHAKVCRASTVDRPAAAMRAVQGPTVFSYRFDWDEEPRVPFLYEGPRLLGAAHGLVAPFVFGLFDLGPDTRFIFGRGSRVGRVALSDAMMSYWAEFAYSGSPGRGRLGDLPEWTAWDLSDADAPKYMVLDTPEGGGLRMAPGSVSIQGAIAALLVDLRFPSARDRCAVLAEWGCLTREQYAAVGACGDYPLETYPWVERAQPGRAASPEAASMKATRASRASIARRSRPDPSGGSRCS